MGFYGREVVIQMMTELKVDAAELTGYNRKNDLGNTVLFDTFDTLSDPVSYFAKAMDTEMEHGKAGKAVDTNVTDDDARATAMIVVAHLKGVEHSRRPSEFITFGAYYDWLWWVEKLHEKALLRAPI